jgi:hypothetical protein
VSYAVPRRHPRALKPRPAPLRVVPDPERARAACVAKDRYASESEARAFALMHVPGRGNRSVPYRCDVCGGWHLTSKRA